jgi:hypothetical protein
MDKIKLSKLLRKGSTMVKSITGDWFQIQDCDESNAPGCQQVVGACAVGMMVVALADSRDRDKCRRAFSLLNEEFKKVSERLGMSIKNTVVGWHDAGKPVDCIARWLEAHEC